MPRAPLPPAPPGCSDTGPQAVWQHSVCSHDVDELAAGQPQWSLQYTQLSRGAFLGQAQIVQLPGVRLVRERATRAVWQRGALGQGHIGLALPLALPGHGSFNGQPLAPDSLMLGPSEQLSLCLPDGFDLIAIVVDATLLQALWQQLYQRAPSAWIHRQLVLAARPGLAPVVRQLHLQVLAGLQAAPQRLHDPLAVQHLRDALLVQWIEALPAQITADGLDTGEARHRLVERACALVAAQPEQADAPLSLLQLCRQVGASPSTLDRSFRSVLGMAPARYLRAARLQGVRRALRQGAAGTVQDLAARWGFWHMGEFAAAYRRQFGELPSRTARPG